ncbi:MAG: hypothetical protein E5X96_08245, partial [Mesorhizobium sp.]
TGPATLAARRATPQPCHLRIEPAFVDEDQTAWIEIELPFEPFFPRRQNVRTLLLGGVRRLFLYVMPRFAKNAWTVVTLALTPRSLSRHAAISASVMSRSSVSTSARMKASCASSFEIRGLPCRPGSRLPFDRQARYHAPDVEIPIENRRAASRVESPASAENIEAIRVDTD